jgi:hypothetical protein
MIPARDLHFDTKIEIKATAVSNDLPQSHRELVDR